MTLWIFKDLNSIVGAGLGNPESARKAVKNWIMMDLSSKEGWEGTFFGPSHTRLPFFLLSTSRIISNNNVEHIFSVCFGPGSVLSDLHLLSHLSK